MKNNYNRKPFDRLNSFILVPISNDMFMFMVYILLLAVGVGSIVYIVSFYGVLYSGDPSYIADSFCFNSYNTSFNFWAYFCLAQFLVFIILYLIDIFIVKRYIKDESNKQSITVILLVAFLVSCYFGYANGHTRWTLKYWVENRNNATHTENFAQILKFNEIVKNMRANENDISVDFENTKEYQEFIVVDCVYKYRLKNYTAVLEAKEYAERQLKYNQKIWQAIGMAEQALGKDECLETLKWALTLTPTDTYILANYELVKLFFTNEKKVLAELEKELLLHPHDLWITYAIGRYYVFVEDYTKAIPYLESIVKIKPTLNNFMLILSYAYMKTGAIQESKKLIAEVYREGENASNAFYEKGSNWYDSSGKNKSKNKVAVQYLEIAAFTGNQDAEILLRNIRQRY